MHHPRPYERSEKKNILLTCKTPYSALRSLSSALRFLYTLLLVLRAPTYRLNSSPRRTVSPPDTEATMFCLSLTYRDRWFSHKSSSTFVLESWGHFLRLPLTQQDRIELRSMSQRLTLSFWRLWLPAVGTRPACPPLGHCWHFDASLFLQPD